MVIRTIITIGVCLLTIALAYSNKIVSPINKLTIEDTLSSYRFIIIGHTYGSHNPSIYPSTKSFDKQRKYGSDNQSIYPSSSVLANLSNFEGLDPDFMIILGDIVNNTTKLEVRAFKESFSSKTSYPIFNAVGNHDLSNQKLYYEEFGKTHFHFRVNKELFIVLNSEETPGKISSEQVKWVLDLLKEVTLEGRVQNIFIFSHRLLWSIPGRPDSKTLPEKTIGTPWYPELVSEFDNKIQRQLSALSDVDVFLISGDIGSYYHPSVFYHKDNNSNITYLATRLDDDVNDMVIIAEVNMGDVSFHPISLGYSEPMKIHQYDFDYWVRKFGEFKEIPKSDSFVRKIFRLISSKKFWTGALAMLMLNTLLLLIMKQRGRL